jgi:hypothetical protein
MRESILARVTRNQDMQLKARDRHRMEKGGCTMSRFASGHRGRAVLIRRLEALEKSREQQPARSAVRFVNVELLPLELLNELAAVCNWVSLHGLDALEDEHRLVLNDISACYDSLEKQGVNIYEPACKRAA